MVTACQAYSVTFKLSVFESPHDKTSKMTVRPAKTQINRGIRRVSAVRSMGS